MATPLVPVINSVVDELDESLINFRRDVHAHPEVGYQEFRTTGRIVEQLRGAGLSPQRFKLGTGVWVDIVEHSDRTHESEATPELFAIRGDIDALPVTEESGVPYASTVSGVSHACGHDVHTTIALGVALTLARLADRGLLRRSVRVIFQPAEEVQPGGASAIIAEGVLQGVSEVYALHCDPKVEVGRIGLREGPLTSATDQVTLTVRGPGGHTSRPHLTADVVGALAAVATQTPLLLSRRVDPRGGVSLMWGRIAAGSVANVIPREGELVGTLRALDHAGWEAAGGLLGELVGHVVAPFGVEHTLEVVRGVPPVVNDAFAVGRLRAAATAILGPDSCRPTEQSLGGEDFGWMARTVPGAMARLGVRTPGGPELPDIHQGNFTVDETAIGVGVRLLSCLAAG